MINPAFKMYAHVVAVYDSSNQLTQSKSYDSAEQAHAEYQDMIENLRTVADVLGVPLDFTVCRYRDGYLMSMTHTKED